MSFRPPTVPPDPAVYLVAIHDTPSADRVLDVAGGLGTALGGDPYPARRRPPSHFRPSCRRLSRRPPDPFGAGSLLLDGNTMHLARRLRGRIVGHVASGGSWRDTMQIASNPCADLIVVGSGR